MKEKTNYHPLHTKKFFNIYSLATLNENFLVFATCLKLHMPTITLS